MLPCDEEEQDRLDLFYKLFTVARVPRNGRFFDVGFGTEIWAIDVAHKYPDAFVVAMDLAPIQPPNHPNNCQFYATSNFESPWPLGEDSWDLIHLQMGCGSVMKIDFEPRCANCSLNGLALGQWYQYLKQATQATIARKEAAFTQIDHRMMKLPLNPWHDDEHETKVARWYSLAFSESLETLSLALSVAIRHLAAEANSEAFNKELRAYNILPSRTKRAFPWE
ncbi:uncharacterized protein BO95DRAFT_450733 [Aspergillus brunneoviolaceus CBS 621.78]|uniref:Uncharacterized protein n=1 Tax=Aspergillus brunneoviolaceus CBS 621.78 TaxID=1450534 RepID=A0ACD1GI47_9EURO|nr:hypothetical protein BO95DRAFT_450733 [Aspergillus brunneoviolaceus CBS 621.78]RAH48835.1 hypothetical protein BO95DRAFT_450733 [Aspergillus brunneoviolaceus CBS 621.78]